MTGEDNTIEENWIRHAGRFGINVTPTAPVNGPTGAIRIFPAKETTGNTLRANDVQGSGRFDLRQWPTACLDHQGNPAELYNTWEGNTYGTKNYPCLQ